MTGNAKRTILTLLGLVILLTVMIAAGLPQLELQPGLPLPRVQEGQVVAAELEQEQSASISVNTFAIVLFALMLAAALLYSAYKQFKTADWNFIAGVLRSVLVIFMLFSGFVLVIVLISDPTGYSAPVELPIPTPAPVITSPLGAAPTPLLWLVGIGLAVVSIIVGVWLFTSSRQASPIDLLGLEAEKAWQSLKAGAGLKDVIIHCYMQMSLAVKQGQGIERQDFMTTGEFERELKATGIPHEPIHQLTRLFEAVRYGNWQSSAAEEQTAIQCLEAIVLYSREAKGRK